LIKQWVIIIPFSFRYIGLLLTEVPGQAVDQTSVITPESESTNIAQQNQAIKDLSGRVVEPSLESPNDQKHGCSGSQPEPPHPHKPTFGEKLGQVGTGIATTVNKVGAAISHAWEDFPVFF
jgi:hypothetical protein